MITSLCSKYITFGYQPTQADNLGMGTALSHVQTVGYHAKYSAEYVITGNLHVHSMHMQAWKYPLVCLPWMDASC